MNKRFIAISAILVVTLMVILSACMFSPSSISDRDDLSDIEEDSEKSVPGKEEFVPDYAPDKANTRGNTVNMLQNKGIFAVQDQWIYYCYANNIYKMPAGGGAEDVYIIYSGDSDKRVKTIQVIGDWIYFYESRNFGNDSQIMRIRTDGKNEEVITEDVVSSEWRFGSAGKETTFVALGEWLYYVSMSTGADKKGNTTAIYHITRIKTDGSEIEILYSTEPRQLENNIPFPCIDFIDDYGTIYFFTVTGGLQRYYTLDIDGEEAHPLFTSVMRANNKNAVLFLFALDEEGNTYFSGYDFFSDDKDAVEMKNDYPYPVYYLDGPLSSLADGAVPTPLVNGPGVNRESPYYHLSHINGQLVTISYNPSNPADSQYEFILYDKSQGKMSAVTFDLPDVSHKTYPEVFADLNDGFIYFGYDMTNTMWWRVKPDGTELEELTWMLTPASPKKP